MGRQGDDGVPHALGINRLAILAYADRLAYLIMIGAPNHCARLGVEASEIAVGGSDENLAIGCYRPYTGRGEFGIALAVVRLPCQ